MRASGLHSPENLAVSIGTGPATAGTYKETIGHDYFVLSNAQPGAFFIIAP
jgi:hypothetical protein